MSTGYSGNYGYSMPTNWAFDQYNEYTFSGFGLDKDAVSGRDNGVAIDTSYHGITYNRNAAKDYMYKWWDESKGTNPAYKHYSADCANFVSQCLTAGGIPQNSGWYYGSHTTINENINNMYDASNDLDVGEAWRKAHRQYLFFSDPMNGYINGDVKIIHSNDEIASVIAQCNAEGNPIQVGDLMYFTQNGEGGEGTHHATIISSVDANSIKYSAHIDSRFDEDLANKHLDKEDVCIIRMHDK